MMLSPGLLGRNKAGTPSVTARCPEKNTMLDIALFLHNQVINLQTIFILKTYMYRQILHSEPFLSNVGGLKVFVKQNEPLKRIIPSIAFFLDTLYYQVSSNIQSKYILYRIFGISIFLFQVY